MSQDPKCHDFQRGAKKALDDERLQTLLGRTLENGFQKKRLQGMSRLPEYEQLRDQARDLKNHVLDHLDMYLARFEAEVTKAGGQVHWARDAAEARDIILDICIKADAKTVSKGKSMIAEEIGLNDHLIANAIVPVETDLGEYIIQLRDEPPSHIIAPAFHISKEQVAETFVENHTHLDPDRDLSEPSTLLNEARGELRQKFINADVGITGANVLIAETGTAMIVTNEGNGDLTQDVAAGAHRDHLHRKSGADAGRRDADFALAGAHRHGSGTKRLQHFFHWGETAGRYRRAG